MKVKAFAKINLGLKIFNRRSDGFHEIDTVFAKIGLHDSLEFMSRNDSKIILAAEEVRIPTRKNLAWQAAWLLQKFYPRLQSGIATKKLGVNIFLKKRIPIGAGLGGGSSDAAAVLKALNKLWGLKLSREKLEKIAASLGSDVPFFLKAGIQRGRGRGELLEKIELAKHFPKNVVVVIPDFRISTSKAFSKIPNPKFQIPNKFQNPKLKIKKINNPKNLANDFEKIVFREFPQLKKIKNNLLKSGAAFASLSGSGSVVFGLFREKKDVKKTARKFEKFGKVFTEKIRG